MYQKTVIVQEKQLIMNEIMKFMGGGGGANPHIMAYQGAKPFAP